MSDENSSLNFPKRGVWIKTYGCQMNYHDTERILHNLQQLNFFQVEDASGADLILFNTCAIRDRANNKFYSHLGEIKELRQKNSDLVVGMGGCIAQVEGADLVKKYPHLDFAFGTDCIDQINDMLYRIYAGENKFVVNEFDGTSDYSIDTKITHGNPHAYINIMKGCNNFCSYCIVPFTRGREKSRKTLEIVDDVRRLVEKKGIFSITLLGQNVNSFGLGNGENLPRLLQLLDDISGIEIIRYTTSHPRDLSTELIDAHCQLKKLSNHLHLPVQSGSNEVLKKMNRRYTREHYLELLSYFREKKPNMVFSTDLIVGFPGESEQMFQQTFDLLTEAQFDFIYSYVFSARPGTAAKNLPDETPLAEKKAWLYKLQQHQLALQKNLRASMVGKVYRVLLEDRKQDVQGELKWFGRTDCNRIVHLKPLDENRDYKFSWVNAKILSVSALSCQARIV